MMHTPRAPIREEVRPMPCRHGARAVLLGWRWRGSRRLPDAQGRHPVATARVCRRRGGGVGPYPPRFPARRVLRAWRQRSATGWRGFA